MKKNIYIIGLVFILLGCSSKRNNYSNPFEKNHYEVKGVKILIGEEKLKDPWSIAVLDSFIIVANSKGQPVLEVYSLQGEKLKETLSFGKGPLEVLCVGNIQPIPSSNSFYLVDLFTKQILFYDIDRLMVDDNYYPKQIFSITNDSVKNLTFTKPIVWRDYYIGHSKNSKGRLVLLKKDGTPIDYFGDFPDKKKVNSKMPEFVNADLYSGGATLSPDGEKLAFVTYSAGMMDLFSLSSDGIKSYWSNCTFLPVKMNLFQNGDILSLAHTNESISGYEDIASNEEFVFAIYSGKKFEDPFYYLGNDIHIVSWDGKKTYLLHTDRLLSRIAVNDNNIYAISQNQDGAPEIISIDLQNFEF